jgi:hypothetical protein
MARIEQLEKGQRDNSREVSALQRKVVSIEATSSTATSPLFNSLQRASTLPPADKPIVLPVFVEPVEVKVFESAPDPRKSMDHVYKAKRVTGKKKSKGAIRAEKRARNRRNKAIRRNADKRLREAMERGGEPLVYVDEDVLEMDDFDLSFE